LERKEETYHDEVVVPAHHPLILHVVPAGHAPESQLLELLREEVGCGDRRKGIGKGGFKR
jgi:hypothetical protein